MVKNKSIYTYVAIISFLVLFLAACFGAVSVADDANADAETCVYFSSPIAEASDSDIVYARITVEGAPSRSFNVTYHTESATAIDGVDYDGVSNTVTISTDSDGKGSYTIAIKSRNDYKRQQLQVRGGDEFYGRYFSLVIDRAEGAVVTQNRCRCYLSYESRVDATLGVHQENFDVSYLDDYKLMQSIYHKGKYDLDGKKTWKSWKNGVSFNNETSTRWLNTFINTGFASAYSTYLVKYVDNSTVHSTTDIYILAGNYEFYKNYDGVEHDIPGCYLYLGFEPSAFYYADKIDGRAMYLISIGKNPFDEDSDLIDVNSADVGKYNKHVYWIQDKDAWYANNNSLTDTVFWRTDPYDGILDMAWVVWNKNREIDIDVGAIWFLMTLIDDTSPTLIGQYVDDSHVESEGKLRICLRFSEPVYASRKRSLSVKLNNGVNPYYAEYVDGDFTDTLIYELNVSQLDISSVNIEMPNEDICDMSYNIDRYKVIRNNPLQGTDRNYSCTMLNGNIKYIRPRLNIDKSSSIAPKNNYELILSINDNGELDLAEGTVYYSWSKEDTLANAIDPSSYKVNRRLYEEDMGSISVSLIKNENEGIDSGTYYLHALAIGKYSLKSTATFGPYVLDGDPPVLVQSPLLQNELKTKTFVIDNYKTGGAAVKNFSLIVKWSENGVFNTRSYPLMSDGVCIPSFTCTDGNRYQYFSNVDDSDSNGDGEPDLRLDEYILDALGDNPRLTASISFEAEDTAGNFAVSNAINVIYDKRDTFKVSATFPTDKGYQTLSDIVVNYPAYDISHAQSGAGVVIAVNEADRSQIVDGVQFQVFVGDVTYKSGPDPYTVVIDDLKAGFYRLLPNILGVADNSEVDLIANPIEFYLTDGKSDPTVNSQKASGNLVLTNKVFLIDEVYYYYLDREDKVSSHAYGAVYDPSISKYNGGSTKIAFSNVTEAKKYVRFMEYQDLHILSLTANQASMLNNTVGTTTYVKASGETRNAQENQLWIRYKKSNWTSSSTAFGWAYYYYGESGSLDNTIDINRLSANLSDAISAVVNRIVSEGSTVYLVTEYDLDARSGAPYLAPAQMHVSNESATKTNLGDSFVNAVVYDGDVNLYKNTVNIGNAVYPLATNMPITAGENTSLFYRYYESDFWYPLSISDGQTFSSLLSDNASGIYVIREYDLNGINEFAIYYDKNVPTLQVIINGEDYTLDGTVSAYSGSTASLKSMLNEADPFAYVALYAYPSRRLIRVLYANEISDYDLGSGNYYVQVGDRSGNIITYTILLSSTQLGVTLEESQSRSGIVARVLNREESEIYSYELYLNEELLTSEYSANRFYAEPGVYRLVVIDIYGNSVTRILEYEFPSPRITWYYLNSMGGYSKYDPDNVVNMMLSDDANNSRITNIYTSTRVRLSFDLEYGDSAIKFEMLDISQGAYSYSESSGVLTINTDESWRLRVWFENYPQNDHTYVCRLDVNAPEYNANFIGVSYSSNLSIDDSTLLDKYEIGDVISFDSLEISNRDAQSLSFTDGSIISGSHIRIGLFDPSGIRAYTVTRNGQPISLSLNEDGELVINNYGIYVVTAIDNLGNSSTFGFINTKEPIATAKVDDVEITEDKYYGQKSFVVTTEYVSTSTISIKTKDASYTYVFDYDGSSVTYGQYVCLSEDVDGVDEKYIDIVKTKGFELRLDDDAVRRDRWYDAIVEVYFTVSVMINSKGGINYKVSSVYDMIDVQEMISVGTNKRPSLFTVALSQKAPTLTLLSDGDPAEIVENLSYIYVAGILSIGERDQDIIEITVGYSQTEAEPQFKTIYRDGKFIENFTGSEDGYYTIVATNVFHNKTTYRVQKIQAFASVVSVTYRDGMTKEFVSNSSVIKSNYMIDLIVYNTNVLFEVNDDTFTGLTVGGTSVLQLNRRGNYSVRVLSSNGIYESFDFEIDTDPYFVFREEWLTGYNEDALLRDEGYTNKLLNVLIGEDVRYADYVYDGKTYVIYDEVSENKLTDKSALNGAVGKNGTGEYTVNYRNVYGDVASKTIRFNTIPSLEISRKTLDNPTLWESLDRTLSARGFYSNYILRFSTESVRYDFRINGVSTSLAEPKDIELDPSSGNGSFEYAISFIDEYGNRLESTATLMRADVVFDTQEMNEIESEGKIYTKDNVCITFSNNYSAWLSIDGGERELYSSGTTYYRDGEYAFEIVDLAGNSFKYTINHKSVNHYSLIDSILEQPIIPGGVVNNATVIFEASDDSFVSTMVKDGKLVESTNNKTFSATGHWELLISDPLGNVSYAEFYLINNSLGEFTYTAPYDYVITEIWKTDANGEKTQLEAVDNSIRLTENGDYVVGMVGVGVLSSYRFTVTIDNTPPEATLSGVENNGTTARNVTLKGLKNGDEVKIYKNGELIETLNVGVATKFPEITTGGDYKLIVTNLQGVSVEYNFTRKSIANTATSVFFIVIIAVVITAVVIGLLLHTRQKTDS